MTALLHATPLWRDHPELREIARELRWDRQRTLFRQMLSQRG